MTTDIIIGILGTAMLAMAAYMFTSFKADVRDFTDKVTQILQEHGEMFGSMEELLGRYDERLKVLEKPKRRK